MISTGVRGPQQTRSRTDPNQTGGLETLADRRSNLAAEGA
jgi:hypothetical protein